MAHKPRNMVTTLDDPEGRETVADLFEGARHARVSGWATSPDYPTSGALLLTNDGEMTDALLRPKAAVPKVYIVKFQGVVGIEGLDALRNGVRLDDGYVTKKAEAFVLRQEARTTVVQLTLTEGKNRQIRRMGDAIGHRVMRLHRKSFAGLSIDDVAPESCDH
ncbi:MAG: pseudouridine synthase [Polyangiales bacterium]